MTERRRLRRFFGVLALLIVIAMVGIVAPSSEEPSRAVRQGTRYVAEEGRFATESTIARSDAKFERQDLPYLPAVPSAAIEERVVPTTASALEAPALPARTLTVRVASVHGEHLAKVALDWIVFREDGAESSREPLGATGADGAPCVATDVAERCARLRPGQRLAVRCAGAWSPPIEREVDRMGTANTDLTLTLPPFGAIEVSVRDSRGLIHSSSIIRCELLEGTEQDLGPGESRVSDRGSVLFERVPLGARFRLGVFHRNDSFPSQDIDGPSVHGEMVRAEFRTDDSRRIRGRLVDRERMGLTRINRIAVMVNPLTQGHGYRITPPLTADGVFEFNYRDLPDAVPSHLRIEIFGVDGERFRERAVPLPYPVPEGVTDLGDIAFEPLPCLASGWVIDPDGRPIEGANVGCMARGARFALSPSIATDRDGKFALYGDPPNATWSLRAMRHGYTPSPPLDIAPGEEDLVLRLDFTGRLAGRVVFPPNAVAEHFSVRFLPDDGNVVLGKLEADGSFAVDYAPLGVGRLVIHGALEFYDQPLLELPGVASRNDGGPPDPRLASIVLGTVSRTIDLEVGDDAGRPVFDFDVFWRDRAGRSLNLFHVVDAGAGRKTFVVPLDLHEFAIEREGCEPVFLIGVDGRRQVVVPREPEVTTIPR